MRSNARARGLVLRGCVAVLPLAGLVRLAPADQLHVPADYPTIQAAVDKAVDGDEVIVAPGVYTEAVNLGGKDIAVRGSGGASVTVLDGAGLNDAIITAVSGESLQTVIQGFHFRNGESAPRRNCSRPTDSGGAMYIGNRSSLTVLDCEFVDNAVGHSVIAGGAIAAVEGGLRVARCLFDGNGRYLNDPDDGVAYGGAIYMCNRSALDLGLEVTDCQFLRNATAGIGFGFGGAINAQPSLGDILIQSSKFEGNDAAHGGAVFIPFRDAGYVTEVTGCDFRDNTASFGGGLNLTMLEAQSHEPSIGLVANCTFEDNEAGFGGGLFGSALFGTSTHVPQPELHVMDCTFRRNVAQECCNTGVYHTACFRDGIENGRYFGGAADLRTQYGGLITVVNCEVAGNNGTVAGGLHFATCSGGEVYLINSTVADNGTSGVHLRMGEEPSYIVPGIIGIANSILWGNGTSDADQLIRLILGGQTSSFARWCDVQGGVSGSGNIDADPRFVDRASGNYRLAGGSPCIDSAENESVPGGVPTDLDGNPRFVDDPATPDTGVGPPPIVDMGPYEFQDGSCDPCDANCDGAVDAFDIEPFIDVVFNGRPPCGPCAADVNGDGHRDAFDIEPFIDCLFGP